MKKCPKCGSNRIHPTFVNGYGIEALRYQCDQCGFVVYGPTLEQRHKEIMTTKAPDHTA